MIDSLKTTELLDTLPTELLEEVRYKRMIKTTDNFCGNYDNDMVAVTIDYTNDYSIEQGKYTEIKNVYIFVSGNDDYYLMKEFNDVSIEKFMELKVKYFDELPNVITRKDLKEMGFYEG